ncbi:MAG: tetratricopeptide repeat protein [Verrucomicrobiota bacterium]
MSLSQLIEETARLYESGELDQVRERLEEAREEYPESFRVQYNLGVVLRDLDDWGPARAAFERALMLRPNEAQAFNNLGLIHEYLGNFPEAIANFRAALSLTPDFDSANFNLSLCLLRLGHFGEGFVRFQSRFGTGQVKPINCPHPLWDGRAMLGTLLVHTEQGAGDAIQFVRYLPMVAERVSRILFVCPQPLMRLFRSVPGIAEMRTAGDFEISSFQAYCPLLTLPHIFDTQPETIPAAPSYLKAPPESLELPPPDIEDPKLKVGICWAGSSSHLGDRHRSVALKDFRPLIEEGNVAFYSLQIDEAKEQLKDMERQVVDLSGHIKDWGDTASLVSQLDLVISVDTGVAHLAAAMGIPVWIALAQHTDWRWGIEGDQSAWYPSARLFRQQEPGDWNEVFAELKHELLIMLQK